MGMLILYLGVLETEEEKDKFEQLYTSHKRFIYSVAYDYMSDLSLVEDAVHNTFLKLINYLDKVNEVNSPETKTFIGIVAKSVCKDMLRKEKSLKKNERNLEYTVDRYFEDEEIKNLVKKINNLPEIYRNIIMLKYFYKMSNQQVCNITGISYLTLRKRLSRAKMYLSEVDM